MYKKDFAILLLSVCALYLSLQNEGTFSFRKAWYHHFEDSDGLLSTEYTLPVPLVADLNGDGKPEIITATPDGNIKVLAPRRFGDGFAEAQLLSELGVCDEKRKERIAGLSSGHIQPQPQEMVRPPRKQVVVVVTSTLRVLCYDHNLRKMWEQDLQRHFPAGGSIRELAVHVSETAISEGDRGLVVVGASVLPPTLADREEQEDALEEAEEREELELAHTRGLKELQQDWEAEENVDKEEGGEDHSQEGRHFSYFAFEGSRGLLRWKHEAEDFVKDLGASRDELVAAHSYRLRAEQSQARHYGELSCRDYRDSVLAVLPHSWHSRLDTRLDLAHFERQREGKGAQKEQLSRLGASKGRPGAHERSLRAATAADNPVTDALASVIRGAMGGGKRQSKTAPNVLVAHVEEGIEAVHLYSGRTVCRLHLPSPGLNADINGDGVPDHVVAHGGNPADLLSRSRTAHARSDTFCTAVATSGVPPTHPLFNGTICRPFRRGLSRATGMGLVEVAPPAMLPVAGKRGRYRVGEVGQKGMVVFLNSRGDLTAYDWQGEMIWQLATAATWSASEYVDDDQETPEALGTLLPMPLRPRAVPTVILAAGSYSAVVVSEHGRQMDIMELPELPSQPMLVADFNFDGYNDIILLGKDGLYGWAQVRRPGAVPFSALLGGMIVILVGVFVTQQGFMQQGGRRKGRSTERVD